MPSLLVVRARIVDASGISDDSWVLARDGAIEAVGIGETWRDRTAGFEDEQTTVDADGETLTPGFVDLHVHGGGGHSFAEEADAIAAGLALHRRHGTTRSLVSFVSGPLDSLADGLRQVADLRERDQLVLGAHAEGPYLSAARRGAHDAAAPRPAPGRPRGGGPSAAVGDGGGRDPRRGWRRARADDDRARASGRARRRRAPGRRWRQRRGRAHRRRLRSGAGSVRRG